MKPKFTLNKSDKVFIGEKYLCNGHWLCTREIVNSNIGPKALKPLLSMVQGCYDSGIGGQRSERELPDFAQVIPSRDGFLPVSWGAVGVEFRGDSDEIIAYKFEALNPTADAGGHKPGFVFGVAANYVPLLRLGHVFAKEACSPILVLDGPSLNDNLIAVVMPIRLNR